MTLTLKDVADALPPHLKSSATESLVDALNNIAVDPEAAEAIRDGFISYSKVLTEGRFKLEDYLNAVAYASFKLMGYSNREAYMKTFPERYEALVLRGASEKDISAYVAAYHKGKLVGMIMEQSIIPSWILNQDAYQKAINTQLELMTNSKSDKVRCEAANSLLTHLKRPETKQVAVSFSPAANDGLATLSDQMLKLAEMQRDLIAGGALTTKEIAHQVIIEAEVVEESETPA